MISILCPTRGRPDSVRRLMRSASATAARPRDLQFVFYVDEDDASMDEQVRSELTELAARDLHLNTHFVVGARILLSECWNVCYSVAAHPILMQCGDDIVFQSHHWDTEVTEAIEAVPDRIVLVYGRDGIQDRGVATHGFLHRNWAEAVGYFVPSLFASDWNDMWLTEVARELGRLAYLPSIYTEHMHPVAGKGPWDRTHQERMDRHNREDCDKIWRDTGDQRKLDVVKLRAFIGGHAAGVAALKDAVREHFAGTPGTRLRSELPYAARYKRHQSDEEERFADPTEAAGFLCGGLDDGLLWPVGVFGPDGSEVPDWKALVVVDGAVVEW